VRGLYYDPRTESETDGEMTICNKVIVIVVSILHEKHHQEFVDFVFLCAITPISPISYLSRIVGFVVRLLCRSF